VACANENTEHSNGSQFFITLGPTESLQKKNTIFGRVGGDTIYNVMEMNSLEVDANDRWARRLSTFNPRIPQVQPATINRWSWKLPFQVLPLHARGRCPS
jgi:cyclophilin family peptidyl-prolyl cis-trans isomerase